MDVGYSQAQTVASCAENQQLVRREVHQRLPEDVAIEWLRQKGRAAGQVQGASHGIGREYPLIGGNSRG